MASLDDVVTLELGASELAVPRDVLGFADVPVKDNRASVADINNRTKLCAALVKVWDYHDKQENPDIEPVPDIGVAVKDTNIVFPRGLAARAELPDEERIDSGDPETLAKIVQTLETLWQRAATAPPICFAEPGEDTVTLLLADQLTRVQIPREVAMTSEVIKNMLEDLPDLATQDMLIPIAEEAVDVPFLKLLLEFHAYQKQHPDQTIPPPPPKQKKNESISTEFTKNPLTYMDKWYQNFCKDWHVIPRDAVELRKADRARIARGEHTQDFNRIGRAANYLDVEQFYRMTRRKIASIAYGASPQEIRAGYGLPPPTEAEVQQIIRDICEPPSDDETATEQE